MSTGNTIFKDKLTEYLDGMYGQAGPSNSGSEYRIDVKLQWFEIDQNQQPDFAEPFSGQGRSRLDLTIQSIVSLPKNGQELDRTTLNTKFRFNVELSKPTFRGLLRAVDRPAHGRSCKDVQPVFDFAREVTQMWSPGPNIHYKR